MAKNRKIKILLKTACSSESKNYVFKVVSKLKYLPNNYFIVV